MADIFDYLIWRGDLEFTQVPFREVDALILSALSYLDFKGIVSEDMDEGISLSKIAETYHKMESTEGKYRVKNDLKLLFTAAKTKRFGKIRFTLYKDVYEAKEEKQFAAVTALLNNDTAAVIFRGTDLTLAGWKEDFNMSFMESIPSQLEAVRYIEHMGMCWKGSFYVTGHSKGGNLSVYASSKCSDSVKNRIIKIYNQDGPGFSSTFLAREEYRKIVPKICTYIPQSSVVGMLFEHEEQYIVVKSKQLGLLQHDPYSWILEGPGFVLVEEVSEGSKRIDQALKEWLEAMTMEERGIFVDTVYEIITQNGESHLKDLLKPHHIRTYMGSMIDEKKRSILFNEWKGLIRSVKNSMAKKENNEIKEIFLLEDISKEEKE